MSEAILNELTKLLRDFQGREYFEPMDRHTRFFADLGFASIDAVVLGETLESHYGQKFPFASWLSGLAARGAQDLELGELADFLQTHLYP